MLGLVYKSLAHSIGDIHYGFLVILVTINRFTERFIRK